MGAGLLRRLHLILGLLIPLAAAAGLYFWLSRPTVRPNIFLITIDALRADHLGAYGYDRDTSPNLDAFAESASVFDNAFTQAALSGPSHAVMMTSLSVPVHGVFDNAIRLKSAQLTLAEILQSAGYETAFFTSYGFVGGYGLDQGFDVAENHTVYTHQRGHTHPDCKPIKAQTPIDAVFRRARGWLGRAHEKPFFLWLHVQHPHASYEPPPPFDRKFGEAPESQWDLHCWETLEDHYHSRMELTREEKDYIIALYDGEIAFVDSKLARFFSMLTSGGYDENTIVVVTSDHGERLFDDAEGRMIGHGQGREDTVLRVPLMIRAPGVTRAGRRVESMVGHLDLAPTLLDLVDVAIPSRFAGRSLVPLLRGKKFEPRPYNYSVTFNDDDLMRLSIRSLEHKMTCDRTPTEMACKLFDLVKDPREHADVVDEPGYAVTAADLRKKLDDWFSQMMLQSVTRQAEFRSEETLEMLRRAGYRLDEPEETNAP